MRKVVRKCGQRKREVELSAEAASAPAEVERRVAAFVGYLVEHHGSFLADPAGALTAALGTLDQCQPVVRLKLWELSPSQECYARYAACMPACAAVPPPWSAACLALCLEELIDCLHRLT